MKLTDDVLLAAMTTRVTPALGHRGKGEIERRVDDEKKFDKTEIVWVSELKMS